MPWVVALLLAGLLGAVALGALLTLLVDRLRAGAGWVRRAMSVAHGLVAVYVAVDVVTLVAGHRPESMLTHVGYAIASVGLPTLLTHRPDPGNDEEAEPGTADEEAASTGQSAEPPHLGVIAVAAAATAVCVLRLQQTW